MEALILLAILLLGSLVQSAIGVAFGDRIPRREGKIDPVLDDRYLRFSAETGQRDVMKPGVTAG